MQNTNSNLNLFYSISKKNQNSAFVCDSICNNTVVEAHNPHWLGNRKVSKSLNYKCSNGAWSEISYMTKEDFQDGDSIGFDEYGNPVAFALEGNVLILRNGTYYNVDENTWAKVEQGQGVIEYANGKVHYYSKSAYAPESSTSTNSTGISSSSYMPSDDVVIEYPSGTSSGGAKKSTGGSLPDLKVTVSTTGNVPIKHTTTTHVRPVEMAVVGAYEKSEEQTIMDNLAGTVKTSNYVVPPGGLNPGDYSVDLPNPTNLSSSENSEYAGANITDFDINVPSAGYGKSFGAAPKTEPVATEKSTTAQKFESEQMGDNFEMDLSGFNFDEYGIDTENLDTTETFYGKEEKIEYERIKIKQPSEEQEVNLYNTLSPEGPALDKDKYDYITSGSYLTVSENTGVKNPLGNPLVYNSASNPESTAKNNIIQQPGLGDLSKDSIDNGAEKQKIEIKDSATSQSISRINSIAAGINAELGGADDASVWRNADGKFNTTRLLADLGGAAVGGVTAGLITSSVMKNNQVKKELKDVKCRIANKDVATWGDSFQVSTSAVKVFKIGG